MSKYKVDTNKSGIVFAVTAAGIAALTTAPGVLNSIGPLGNRFYTTRYSQSNTSSRIVQVRTDNSSTNVETKLSRTKQVNITKKITVRSIEKRKVSAPDYGFLMVA